MVYHCCPLAVVFKVEADAHVLMVGVHFGGGSPVCVVERSLRMVQPAAAAYVLAFASAPLGSGIEIGEVAEVAIVGDGNHRLAAASGVVWPSVLVAVQVKVSPAFGSSSLCLLTHIVAPLLALIGGNVTFEKSPVLFVDSRPHWGQCQFAVVVHSCFNSCKLVKFVVYLIGGDVCVTIGIIVVVVLASVLVSAAAFRAAATFGY